MGEFVHVWASLGQLVHVWASLGHFGQLDQSVEVWAQQMAGRRHLGRQGSPGQGRAQDLAVLYLITEAGGNNPSLLVIFESGRANVCSPGQVVIKLIYPSYPRT